MRIPRARPKRLHTKLLAIRQGLQLSQYQLAQLLEIGPYNRVSEYETGKREPNLIRLLRYARLAKVPVETIIDDELDLPCVMNPRDSN